MGYKSWNVLETVLSHLKISCQLGYVDQNAWRSGCHRLEFKHGSLAIYFCFVTLATCRYCITRKIACYNCWPVSWLEIQDSHQPFNCLGGFIQFESIIMEILSYLLVYYLLCAYRKPNSKISLVISPRCILTFLK